MPFLKWDPTVAPAAPAGHLGDPTVDHQVTGSPYGTNVFRIEGPAGSFTGSPDLCANVALGDSVTATDDCIETNLFTVMGKTATRAGVQVTKTVTTKDGAGNFIDLFAKSEPGQTLVITGTGVAATAMREDGNGGYYARIRVDGAAPADLAVTNTIDNPKTVDHVDPAQFGDKVHVNSALYDNDTKSLIVLAQSGDPAAVLTLAGYPSAVQDTSGTSQRFTVSGLNAPPADVMVTSSKGGRDGDDVVIAGAAFSAQQVVASIFADVTDVATGQKVTLDGTGSTGTIMSYAWTMTRRSGRDVHQQHVTDQLHADRRRSVPVQADHHRRRIGNTSSQNININAFGTVAPVANAGSDQLNVAPTSTVTLNGTASAFAANYAGPRPWAGHAVPDGRRQPDVHRTGQHHAADAEVHADGQGRGWPPAVRGHCHGDHRPRRPRCRLGELQAGRRRMRIRGTASTARRTTRSPSPGTSRARPRSSWARRRRRSPPVCAASTSG